MASACWATIIRRFAALEPTATSWAGDCPLRADSTGLTSLRFGSFESCYHPAFKVLTLSWVLDTEGIIEVIMRAVSPTLVLSFSILALWQGSQPFLTHGEWIMGTLTAIYVGITGFYAWVSHKTLRAIERQAKDQADAGAEQMRLAHGAADAAQKSASAALLNAQALISAERPWIIVVA